MAGETDEENVENDAPPHEASESGGMKPILEDHHGEEDHEEEESLELTESALELKAEMEQMNLAAPVLREVPETFASSDFPESYQINSNKEKVVLTYVENFRRQYIHLYRDRKPLFLTPTNEFYLEKFVCMTIRPVELPFKELYNWDGAAEFVADYLSYKPLDPAYELPERMFSPTTVIALQKGHCFEFSTLLASLLIGVGYDAYVVSGYASREVCLMDETREICPLLIPKFEPPPLPPNIEQKKYAVRPPKDLSSRFERVQEDKRLKVINDEEAARKAEEDERIRVSELPSGDPLHGLRVHSWVLVLDGKREVAEPFFIEPLNGQARPLDYPNYHGIESVWNQCNYWACMQDCADGVGKLKFDLSDCSLWEYIFPSNTMPKLKIEGEDDDEDGEKNEDIEKHMDLPPSWISPVCLTARDFSKRCPYGKKIVLYKRAKLEKFSPYLMKDGLVCRLSMYEDLERTNLLKVKELYQHRADKLYERLYNYSTGWITEHFSPGRAKKLKEHHYMSIGMIPENQRTMTFYTVARFDGLEKRVETATEMTEHYVGRDDFLYYRYVEYGVRPKKFGPAENTPRPVEKMIERYHRNRSKPANEDIAEMYFNVGEEKITLTYHREDSKISATMREFIKPSADDEKGSVILWNQEASYVIFQSDPSRKDKKRVELYQMMLNLMKSEERCEDKIRDSEREVQDMLDERIKEEAASELEISIYDTERNDKAKRRRAMLEQLALEAQLASQEKELDHFAPFLSQMGNPSEKLTRQQALKLREDCLADLKQRLIDKANLIQARFEKETHELQKKQAWFQQNQVTMQKEDEQEYVSYCGEAMFRIHILELRLNRHKEMAPLKYMALERKIRADPRIAEFL